MVPSPRPSPLHRSQIRLDRSEHDRLLLLASKYENLCQNLIRGGVDLDTIEILAKTNDSQNGGTDSFDSGDDPDSLDETQTDSSSPASTVVNYRGRSHSASDGPLYARKRTYRAPESDAESDSFYASTVSHDDNSLVPDDSASVVGATTPHAYEQNARRTLQLSDLPPATSRADVVAVVRGGPLVDVFFNFREHRASVSFVHGDHANKYYEYAQAKGVYIQGCLINVSWSPRQFILAPYISQQLRGGASRNLVVRYYDRRITEESIRADLEHIHNLAVIKIEFSGLDCYIGINSITAASFARTCMMSRYPYRGSRIEWAPDECMQSLGPLKSQATRIPLPQTKASMNRFSVLEISSESDY